MGRGANKLFFLIWAKNKNKDYLGIFYKTTQVFMKVYGTRNTC